MSADGGGRQSDYTGKAEGEVKTLLVQLLIRRFGKLLLVCGAMVVLAAAIHRIAPGIRMDVFGRPADAAFRRPVFLLLWIFTAAAFGAAFWMFVGFPPRRK